MKGKSGIVWAVVLLVAGVAASFWWFGGGTADGLREGNGPLPRQDGGNGRALGAKRTGDMPPQGGKTPAVQKRREAAPSETDAPEGEDEPQTEEEKAAAEEEAKVDAFDNLTDKWMDPSKTGVTMKDVDEFVSFFRKVPKGRQDECIHRALNLVPDENVMLLAGVLMDGSMDKEIVETVFNDILNRDEEVKKPILQQIFKDKSHPCWADTAWILDVTGDLPKAESNQAPSAQ